MKSRVPKNIGGAQNMNSMIKQAQKMQDEITELQNDIEARDFSATSGGGAVEVVVTGAKNIKALTINHGINESSASQTADARALNLSISRGFRHAKELKRKGRHTLYLGGMLTSIWIWSGQVSASIISTPLYSHSFLRMLPISARICS